MDKKKKRMIVLAVCFVAVCGIAYLVFHYSAQNRQRMVFQTQTEDGAEPSDVLKDPVQKNFPETVTTENAAEVSEKEPELCVFVCGAVETEGVYFFGSGSRVADAINAAGGFSPTADRTYHNLAAHLSDGQKIYVPTSVETTALSVEERVDKPRTEPEAKAENDGLVNLNTAGKEELMTLAGVGEAKAENILLYRQKVGVFERKEELKNVNGIGDAMYERIQDKITVE